jgi:biotin transport system substrate-specific component
MSSATLSREITISENAEKAVWFAFFLLATTLAAQVRIPLPFTPVPITLQTFFVLMSGVYLGRHLGPLCQFAYLLLGGLGLPLFTSTGALLGPTGGYIAGFVLAAWLAGYAKEYKKSAFLILAASDVILLSSGTAYLSLFVGGLKRAFLLGFLPFITGDLIKVTAAYFMLRNVKSGKIG